LHDGDCLLLQTLFTDDLSLTHRQGRTYFVCDLPDGYKSIRTSNRTNELDLGLYGEDVKTRLRNCHGGVAASAIKDAHERASVNVAVLLAQLRPRRQRDMDLTFGDMNQFRAQHGHEAVGAEAGGDSLF
jgi:hypothetical protein